MSINRPRARDNSLCCIRCFRDRTLVRKIREEGQRGECSWCGATDVQTVPVAALGDLFRQLAGHYALAASYGEGSYLDDLVQEDWEVFAEVHETGMLPRRRELMLAILESGLDPKDDVDYPDYRDLFVRPGASAVDLVGQWDERLEAVLFPSDESAGHRTAGSDEEFDYIDDALSSAGELYLKDAPLYRARIHKVRSRRSRFGPDEMGAPPPDRTPVGRGNRAEEPVLYLASSATTALAEVRAWKGALVAIGSMRLVREARILNLVRLSRFGSPFGIESLTWWLDARELLRRFGEELSRPIIPGEEARHYLPSQHACSCARKAGYDGIAYPSAMGSGHNVVLFDPTGAVATEVEYRRVLWVAHRTEAVRSAEVQVDDWPWD